MVVMVYCRWAGVAATVRSARSPPSPPHHQLFATSSPASPRIAMMSQTDDSNVTTTNLSRQPSSRSIFSVPTPIKQLFDQFPLVTYPVNDFPQRAPRHHNAHVLYVFTTDEGAIQGAPSHNPACLKWQVSICPHPNTPLPSSHYHRRTSSFRRYPFELPLQTTMPLPAVHYLS